MSLFSTFKSGKNYIKRKDKRKSPRADNFVFRLHYQFTFGILWVAMMLVAGQNYIDSSGSAIQCMQDKGNGVPGKIMNNYCWIMSTYTLPRLWDGETNIDFIHPGVGPVEDGEEKVYHNYYLWVPYMLAFQAACFYVPHWIWKQLEGGRLQNIVQGLNEAVPQPQPQPVEGQRGEGDQRPKQVKQLAEYMKDRLNNPWDHQMWAAKFYFCEFLNFVNIVVQIKITDVFLGGAFSNFGLAAASWSSQDEEFRTDPLIRIFPRMTKCHFGLYGGSGTLQKFDALCVLGMNIINEKVYVVLWFWFMLLAVITGVSIVFRIAPVCVPSVRKWGAYNMRTIIDKFDFKFANRGSRGEERKRTEEMLGRLTFPDWLVVKHLGECMDKDNFADLINMMANNLDDVDVDEEKVSNDSTLPLKTKFTDRFKGRKSDV
jgi:hypothetical protein